MVRFHIENESDRFSASNACNAFYGLISIGPDATAIRAGPVCGRTVGTWTVGARAVVVVHGQTLIGSLVKDCAQHG